MTWARLAMLLIVAVVLGTMLRWGCDAYRVGVEVGRLLVHPVTTP